MNVNDMLLLERHRSTCNWIPTYGFVERLARSVDAQRLCEVGVAYGYHAEHMLDHMPGIEYQGVDPYVAGYDVKDSFARDVAQVLYRDEPQRAMDRLHRAVHCKLGLYDGRANLVRATSVRGAARMADGYFDLVYIDGDHTYDGVINDLNAWYAKVRQGGILCGDDFDWAGVRNAVVDFMTAKGRHEEVVAYLAAGPNSPAVKWSIAM